MLQPVVHFFPAGMMSIPAGFGRSATCRATGDGQADGGQDEVFLEGHDESFAFAGPDGRGGIGRPAHVQLTRTALNPL